MKFILELFGIRLPKCCMSFDSFTLMRAEWLNLYVLLRYLGSWETHVSNQWTHSIACILIALLLLIHQDNAKPQEDVWKGFLWLQRKEFTGTVKAVQLSAHLISGCQDGNWHRNETLMKFRIFTGPKSEGPQDLTLTIVKVSPMGIPCFLDTIYLKEFVFPVISGSNRC